jgi:type II secretory pathway pseudopilin PulG
LELLLVIAVVGILVLLVLPSSQPGVHDQLQATARIVAADLAYARGLAVSNNSNYRFTFDLPNNRYVMQHSGSNSTLATLPDSPFRSPGDPPTQHIVRLGDLPHLGPTVKLVVAATGTTSSTRTDTLEFGPLGQTTATSPTTIWLSAGSNADARYITVQVNPVTGLADVGPFGRDGPPPGLVGL